MVNPKSTKPRILLRYLCVVFTIWAAHIQALPEGGQVISGLADIQSSSANDLNITQHSDVVTLDFTSFSINPEEIVRYVQPSTNSLAVNQVSGNNISEIFGRLEANGQIFLVNPNGVIFGENAHVDVASLIVGAGTLTESGNTDLELTGTHDAKILNLGSIVASGGDIALLASQIENKGSLEATGGDIQLLSGSTYLIKFGADSEYYIQASASDLSASIKNHGSISTNGGDIEVEAALENQLLNTVILNSGNISAQRIEDRDGRIFLNGSGGDIENQGLISTSNITASTNETSPGAIVIEANRVAQLGEITADNNVDGNAGSIDIRAHDKLLISATSNISANANVNGRGGNINAIANNALRFENGASITARGGDETGNGGTVEVSGLNYIDIQGAIDVKAPNGDNGTIIIDPIDLTISNGGGMTFSDTGGNNFEFDTASGSVVDTATITDFLRSGNVLITTDQDGPDEGTLTVEEAINLDGSNGNTLTLRSNQSMQINNHICDMATAGICDGTGDQTNLRLETSAGTLTINPNVILDSNGGTINVNASNAVLIQSGARLETATASGLGNTINITNSGPLTIEDNASIDAGDGNILVITNGNVRATGLTTTSTNARAIDIISSGALSGSGADSIDLNAPNGGLRISSNTGISELVIDTPALDITNDISNNVSFNVTGQTEASLTNIDVINDLNINQLSGDIVIAEGALSNLNSLSLTTDNGNIQIPDAGMTLNGDLNLTAHDIYTTSSRALTITANDFVFNTSGDNDTTHIIPNVSRLDANLGGSSDLSITSNSTLNIQDINGDTYSLSLADGNLSIHVDDADLSINNTVRAQDQLADSIRSGLIDITVSNGNFSIGNLGPASIESINQVDQDAQGGLGITPTNQTSIRIRQIDIDNTNAVFEFGDSIDQDAYVLAEGGDILIDVMNHEEHTQDTISYVQINPDLSITAINSFDDLNDGQIILHENLVDNGATLTSGSGRTIQINTGIIEEPQPDPETPNPEIPTEPTAMFNAIDLQETTAAALNTESDSRFDNQQSDDNVQTQNTVQFILGDYFHNCSADKTNTKNCESNKLLQEFLGSLFISSEMPAEEN